MRMSHCDVSGDGDAGNRDTDSDEGCEGDVVALKCGGWL